MSCIKVQFVVSRDRKPVRQKYRFLVVKVTLPPSVRNGHPVRVDLHHLSAPQQLIRFAHLTSLKLVPRFTITRRFDVPEFVLARRGCRLGLGGLLLWLLLARRCRGRRRPLALSIARTLPIRRFLLQQLIRLLASIDFFSRAKAMHDGDHGV